MFCRLKTSFAKICAGESSEIDFPTIRGKGFEWLGVLERCLGVLKGCVFVLGLVLRKHLGSVRSAARSHWAPCYDL